MLEEPAVLVFSRAKPYSSLKPAPADSRVPVFALAEVSMKALATVALMEVGTGDSGHQPSGRVTVFPDSVVFLPDGSFPR